MGYRIKECRKKAKMTQEELALASGVCRTTIYNLENKVKTTTTTTTLMKIAKALGVTVDEIFFDEDV